MKRFSRMSEVKTLVCLLSVAALALAGGARAQVSVSPAVSSSGGLYHYDYSVTNATTNDLLFVDVDVAKDPGAATSLVAPAGYKIAFDFNLGLLTFLEDSSFFTGSAVSGFTFDSLFAPVPTTFVANSLDINANFIQTPGATLGPAAVPEPGLWGLLSGFGAMTLCTGLILRRRRA